MKHSEFSMFFPDVDDCKSVRGGQAMVDASHGEIDACASFTLEQILFFQQRATSSPSGPNNFFTNYTLTTMIKKDGVLEKLMKYAQTKNGVKEYLKVIIALRQQNAILEDTNPRDPSGWRDHLLYK